MESHETTDSSVDDEYREVEESHLIPMKVHFLEERPEPASRES